MAPHVLVSSMVSESRDNRAEKHLVFNEFVWFCILWNVFCELLRMAWAPSSAPMVVLEKALALGLSERLLATDCACALAL